MCWPPPPVSHLLYGQWLSIELSAPPHAYVLKKFKKGRCENCIINCACRDSGSKSYLLWWPVEEGLLSKVFFFLRWICFFNKTSNKWWYLINYGISDKPLLELKNNTKIHRVCLSLLKKWTTFLYLWDKSKQHEKIINWPLFGKTVYECRPTVVLV
jgi:hypothetical protein